MSGLIKSLMYVLLFGSLIGSILPGKRFDKYLRPLISLCIAICAVVSFGTFFGGGIKLPDFDEGSAAEYDAAAEACRISAELTVGEYVREFDPELKYTAEAEVELKDGMYNIKSVRVYANDPGGLEEWLREKAGMENIYVENIR